MAIGLGPVALDMRTVGVRVRASVKTVSADTFISPKHQLSPKTSQSKIPIPPTHNRIADKTEKTTNSIYDDDEIVPWLGYLSGNWESTKYIPATVR